VVIAAPSTPASAVAWISPRLTRLEVRRHWRAAAIHVEDTALLRDLGEGIRELWIGRLTDHMDAIFIGGTVDNDEWMALRASLTPTGVVWRISPTDAGATADATLIASATSAGFTRLKRLRYSSMYMAEQFTSRSLRRALASVPRVE
jgi:hypothetical protein